MSENEKRPWQTGGLLKLSTNQLLTKEPREYVFKEINQEYGSKIFWRYVIVILQQWPQIQDVIKSIKEVISKSEDETKMLDKISVILSGVVHVIPNIFPWESIKELSEILLADHVVEVNEDKYSASGDGFSNMPGDPFEVYNALFFAMCVNWPKYFSPLLGAALSDSIPASESEPKQNEQVEN